MSALSIGAAEFERLTGFSHATVAEALAAVELPALRYRPLAGPERRAALAELEASVGDRPIRAAGANDPAVWERGWGEASRKLSAATLTLEALRPQYFHEDVPCRLNGELVRPESPGFEYWLGVGLRALIFRRYLPGWSRIVELGCGTGLNLLLLSRLFRAAELIGSDWVAPSLAILDQMSRETGRRIEGRLFNMLTLEGWDGPELDRTTALLTVHALEQLGTGWDRLLGFMLERRPGICVHVEPLYELYDPELPLDALARRYHVKRNYLRGYLPRIQALAAEGKAEITALHRVPFGGLYHEAYSVLVWRPL
jgi:hypothetical protein